MTHRIALILAFGALTLWATGCKRSGNKAESKTPTDSAQQAGHDDHDGNTHDDGDHQHADDSDHAHDDVNDHDAGEMDHAHDEVSLGTAMVGDMSVEFAQGHGAVEAGQEGHLVVKLPYNDKGQTIVRAWIGTANRLTSVVGKADYAPSHDDYDVHAVAPDPLPEGVQWWVEIEKPDGTKLVGSIDAIVK